MARPSPAELGQLARGLHDLFRSADCGEADIRELLQTLAPVTRNDSKVPDYEMARTARFLFDGLEEVRDGTMTPDEFISAIRQAARKDAPLERQPKLRSALLSGVFALAFWMLWRIISGSVPAATNVVITRSLHFSLSGSRWLDALFLPVLVYAMRSLWASSTLAGYRDRGGQVGQKYIGGFDLGMISVFCSIAGAFTMVPGALPAVTMIMLTLLVALYFFHGRNPMFVLSLCFLLGAGIGYGFYFATLGFGAVVLLWALIALATRGIRMLITRFRIQLG